MDNKFGKDRVKELDFVTIYKMMFIYNAVQKGWTVRKQSNGRFEFTNDKEEIIKNFYLDDFLKNFVESNMEFSSILGIS